MRPEIRLGVGVVATLVFAMASFAVHSADSPSAALPAASSDGSAVFTARGCSACHMISGSGGGIGPDLTELATRAGDRVPGLDAEAYVRQSIRQPPAFLVPGFQGVQMPTLPLSDTELDAVVSFLLHRNPTPSRPAGQSSSRPRSP